MTTCLALEIKRFAFCRQGKFRVSWQFDAASGLDAGNGLVKAIAVHSQIYRENKCTFLQSHVGICTDLQGVSACLVLSLVNVKATLIFYGPITVGFEFKGYLVALVIGRQAERFT